MTATRLVRATPDDLPIVSAILAERAEWLTEDRGMLDQWPRGGFPPERLLPSLIAGTTWLWYVDGDPAGTCTLDCHADPEFWTTADNPGDALYLHKMASTLSVAGRGLGRLMCDWATDRTASAGRSWLRLDAAHGNPELLRYYQRLGFQHVRTVVLPHRKSGTLYQRPAVAMPYVWQTITSTNRPG